MDFPEGEVIHSIPLHHQAVDRREEDQLCHCNPQECQNKVCVERFNDGEGDTYKNVYKQFTKDEHFLEWFHKQFKEIRVEVHTFVCRTLYFCE